MNQGRCLSAVYVRIRIGNKVEHLLENQVKEFAGRLDIVKLVS